MALNVHFHSVVLAGVYTLREDGSVRFVLLPPLTDEEIVALTKKVGRSVRRALERAGKLLDDLDPEPDSLAAEDPALAALYEASEFRSYKPLVPTIDPVTKQPVEWVAPAGAAWHPLTIAQQGREQQELAEAAAKTAIKEPKPK